MSGELICRVEALCDDDDDEQGLTLGTGLDRRGSIT